MKPWVREHMTGTRFKLIYELYENKKNTNEKSLICSSFISPYVVTGASRFDFTVLNTNGIRGNKKQGREK
jgi:hypothetical protein